MGEKDRFDVGDVQWKFMPKYKYIVPVETSVDKFFPSDAPLDHEGAWENDLTVIHPLPSC